MVKDNGEGIDADFQSIILTNSHRQIKNNPVQPDPPE